MPERAPAGPARRAAHALAAAVGLAILVATLRWAVGSPQAALRALGASERSDFNALLVAAVGLAAWALVAWFGLAVTLEAASSLPGATGHIARRLARRVGPRFLRSAARWLVGVALLAGPLVATPAMAASGAQPPSLDRPAATATTHMSAAQPPSAQSPAGHPPSLDRPGAPYVPPPPPRATSNSPPVGVVGGAAHRDLTDDAYVVRRGDSLWDVAARHLGPDASPTQIAREWPRWYAANRQVIGADPSLIRPGMTLHPPRDQTQAPTR